MPIMTDDQRKALATRLAEPDCKGLDDAAAADLLNAPSLVANPDPATRPATFNSFTVVGLISGASVARVLALPSFEATVRPLLNKQPKSAEDAANLCYWAAGLAKAGFLDQAEFDALAAPFPGTTPDAPVGLFNATEAAPDRPDAVATGPSWAAANFAGAQFLLPDKTTVSGQVTAAMVKEARA